MSGPTYCLTSCSPVDSALVYQPSGPWFDSWHVSFRVSYYKGGNPNDAAATYLIFVNYILLNKNEKCPELSEMARNSF
jgi:hypothetical protein